METAIMYILAYALLAVIILSVITLIVVMVLNIKKQKTVGKNIRIGTIVGIVLVCMITPVTTWNLIRPERLIATRN